MAWNQPTVWCELYLSGSWEDLRDVDVELVGLNIRRGRQDELGDFEPGSATIRLSDPTGASELENFDVWTPVRVLCTWNDGSSTHTGVVIWQGFVHDIQPEGGADNLDRHVVVTAVDFLGVANNTPMPDSQWAYWIKANSPLWWLRGYSNASSDDLTGAAEFTVWDYAAGSIDADEVSGSVFAAGEPIAVNSNVPSISLGTGARVGTDASVGSGATNAAWSVAFAFRMASISGTEDCWMLVGRSTSVAGDLRWGVRVDESTGEVTAEIRDSANTVIGTVSTSIAGRHDDGENHVCHVRFYRQSGGNRFITIYTDLDDGGNSANITGTPRGSGGFIVTGNTSGTRPAFEINEIAYWDSDIDPTGLTAWSPILTPFADITTDDTASTFTLWYGDDTTERYTNTLASAGPPTGGLTVATEIHDDLASVWLGLVAKGTFGDHITTLGNTVCGAAYILRDGTLRIRDGAALAAVAHAADYATVQVYVSDAASPSTPYIRVKAPTVRRRFDKLVNQVTLSTAAGYTVTASVFRSIDNASIQDWGLRPLDISTEAGVGLLDLDDLDAVLDSLLVTSPPREVGQIEFMPLGDVDAFTFALLDLELEKVVNLTVENVVTNDEYRVIAEEWDWSAGMDLRIRMNLAPV